MKEKGNETQRNACQTPRRSRIFFGESVKIKGKGGKKVQRCGKVQLYKEGRPYVFFVL